MITDVYKDPLEFCMEGIEEMARKILKTGRLAITGEPGGEWELIFSTTPNGFELPPPFLLPLPLR